MKKVLLFVSLFEKGNDQKKITAEKIL